MFSFRSLIVLAFTFRSMVDHKLIPVNIVVGGQSSFFLYGYPVDHHQLLKGPSSFH